MSIALIGMGMGTRDSLTVQALDALSKAKAILGAQRLLDCLPEEAAGARVPLLRGEEILRWLRENPHIRPVCAVFSGDVGFYSGATGLRPLLEQAGYQVESICGVSSPVYFCARLGMPWQGVHLASAHGRDCDILAHVLNCESCFFLTGGETTPGAICSQLEEAGLGDSRVFVGENLSYPQERVVTGSAAQLAGQEFAPLSAVLVQRQRLVFAWAGRACGIPDGEFLRGEVPVTKQEVRGIALAKLAPKEDDILWDVGAGTGSVAVECALAARWGRVYAIEQNPQALELIRQNRERFGVYNLIPVAGCAPQACQDLPPPSAVFIGGSKGRLEEIFTLLLQKNRSVRVALTAVTLETMYHSVTLMEKLGFGDVEAVQVGISRAEKTTAGHLLRAQNPVFVVSGGAHG